MFANFGALKNNKHTAELASRAEKFPNKLSTFLTSMQGVGNQLDKAKATYDKALDSWCLALEICEASLRI